MILWILCTQSIQSYHSWRTLLIKQFITKNTQICGTIDNHVFITSLTFFVPELVRFFPVTCVISTSCEGISFFNISRPVFGFSIIYCNKVVSKKGAFLTISVITDVNESSFCSIKVLWLSFYFFFMLPWEFHTYSEQTYIHYAMNITWMTTVLNLLANIWYLHSFLFIIEVSKISSAANGFPKLKQYSTVAWKWLNVKTIFMAMAILCDSYQLLKKKYYVKNKAYMMILWLLFNNNLQCKATLSLYFKSIKHNFKMCNLIFHLNY